MIKFAFADDSYTVGKKVCAIVPAMKRNSLGRMQTVKRKGETVFEVVELTICGITCEPGLEEGTLSWSIDGWTSSAFGEENILDEDSRHYDRVPAEDLFPDRHKALVALYDRGIG